MSTPGELAATYFDSWKARDFDTLRTALADDATFRGPLGSADGGDECVAGLQGMAEIMTDVVVLARVEQDDDVITWFELHTSVAPPVPTANWMHVEGGKIVTIRATFDPRDIVNSG